MSLHPGDLPDCSYKTTGQRALPHKFKGHGIGKEEAGVRDLALNDRNRGL